ncbi:hypothetical protein [Kineobactrum salinum]|uniref:RiboL-PSP-HEPN domain-containing protein n=1 Tax=Kineobactrum salinum TaxID=2708301 RepID=A0A6C0U8Y1_9GAMM|nr:hypothetical protein [Kineobactrum salinum]QIB67035.1 hypothetical protein G3T16_18195 [Kineobactrum salinum]
MNKNVKVTAERHVRTYTELWHTSFVLLELGKEDERGRHHKLMGSLVFTAFAFEAYLNHLGPSLFETWSHIERLSPKAKFEVLAERVGLKADFGCRPQQTIIRLFGFRNDIAHGKSITLKDMRIESLEVYQKDPWSFRAQTDWEKYCTIENTERAREDINSVVHTLHKASEIKDEYPFLHGFEIRGGELIIDDNN